jgi:hypothetical protein
MKTKRLITAAIISLFMLGSALADGADPKTVTPAWVTEKQLTQQTQSQGQAEAEAPKPKNFNVFFIGYDYPTLSGPLASHLTGWNSPVNFSLGIESSNTSGSSFLSGLELEFFLTVNGQGMRMQMNDMVMAGYSFNLKPVRFNVGARLGLSLLDVTDDNPANPTYTALGGIIGPEASLYAEVAPDFWLWARGRYSMAYYFTIDSSGGASPIDSGDNTLNCVSLEAGLAFRM